MVSQKNLEVALGALEELELPSLVWGFVDSYVLGEQLLDAIQIAFERNGIALDPEDALGELEERHLVRYWLSDDDRCYRSRFAELLRLIARSKQLFDKVPWRSAPTLVSDYRLDISPRQYPKRNIPIEAALSEFTADGVALTGLQTEAWKQILDAGGMANLSRFQLDSFKRIFPAGTDLGTIITAGTGSGKTLAFYLPALLSVVERLSTGTPFTKVLSIYPRNELLKDQLSEVYKLARSTNLVIRKKGKPPFSVGALYGQIPLFAGEKAVKDYAAWPFKRGGYLCPFVRCPDCGAETIWKPEDLASKTERVHCVKCAFVSDPSELKLTRNSISSAPPDFLFTTTEMLNQRMSDTKMRRIFGVGARHDQKPSYILLDEVHTYVGTTGAQTALLLRRWQRMLGRSVHWVGLSATLEEASEFFSDLSGLFVSSIQEISPNSLDMDEEGADYQLLVRTDPSSQAATLSTSIQTLMLLARMLDPSSDGPSLGLFGRRVFAFTDDLDVTNRLFDDFKDAEAYLPWGKDDDSREPLAQLRSGSKPDPEERDRDGQLWTVAEDLRKNLTDRLKIGRTTSRDPGILADSDVVVATASLEVGFNDPDVGAILQHKAPRSNSSFVQRKGRAGRKRGMRPIMVTVLSDYGRDRLAFQAYEELFSPQIERQRLPVQNGYILRMQAVCALFDWISVIATHNRTQGWSWDVLSRPRDARTNQKFLDDAKDVIQDLVRLEPNRIEAFRRHLKSSLKIEGRILDLILWEQPRSILLEVLPTLARRLFRDWKLVVDPSKYDLFVPYHPLPDFMPRQLFGELNLPEVQISVPPSSQYKKERVETLRIRQALTEFTPGKVRRRFADDAGHVAHWYPLDPDQEKQVISVHEYAERSEFLGQFPVPGGTGARVFRPWAMRVEQISRKARIRHSSTARWIWESTFGFEGKPNVVELSNYASWRDYIPKLEFYLHRLASAVTIRRYAHRGVATLSVNGETRRIEFKLVDTEAKKEAAVGFAYESDGILIPLQLPTIDEFNSLELPVNIKRWLKTLWYREKVQNDEHLPDTLNSFRRDWLSQIVLHAAVRLSEEKSISLREAFKEISQYEDAHALRLAVAATVASVVVDNADDREETRLEDTLISALEESGVLRQICDVAFSVLWPSGNEWGEWLRGVFAKTIAEATLHACVISTPKNTAIEGLVNDLIFEGNDVSVLIAESILGGGGTIEALSEKFSSEPRSFFKAVEAALAPSDSENAARNLTKILQEIVVDGDCRDALGELRRASTSTAREQARIKFAKDLSALGIQYSRAVGVSFSTRFVRSDASEASDQLAKKLVAFWDKLEEKHDLSLPLRVTASLSDLDPKLKADLTALGGEGRELSTAERQLWAREGELRQYGLQSYNSYRDPWTSDAGLVRAMISGIPIEKVIVENPNWEEHAKDILAKNGIVALTSSTGTGLLTKAILDFLSRPVEVGYYNFYPTIDAYRDGDSGGSEAVLALREKV